MQFSPPLARGVLVRRYKRFLADVECESGAVVTMHCPNTGAMSGCDRPGSIVWYSTTDRATRKYPNTLELVQTPDGDLVGINSARANDLVAEGLRGGRIAGVPDGTVVREASMPGAKQRFDFMIRGNDGTSTCIEVKSVTLARCDGVGAFPDARSVRATLHVRSLERMSRTGTQALLLYCVQHSGIRRVVSADDIDPDYAAAVHEAVRAGVRVLAYATKLSPQGITLGEALPHAQSGRRVNSFNSRR
jgi:sugar fermentation stimulation protein A